MTWKTNTTVEIVHFMQGWGVQKEVILFTPFLPSLEIKIVSKEILLFEI